MNYADNDRREDLPQYLLFELDHELFGAPLLDVREVIEWQAAKPVPNTVECFLGVINLRGEIVGVIDLRRRFGLPRPAAGLRPVLLVFNSPGGALAAVIDRLHSVETIPPEQIDAGPAIPTRLPAPYLLGIGKAAGKLVTLLDLKSCLGKSELHTVQSAAEEFARQSE